MWTYLNSGKTYNVELLSEEAQATFSLLATVQNRLDSLQADLTIAQAAGVALHQKMQEFLSDEAIIKDDESED